MTFHGGIGEERREAIKAAFNADPARNPLRILVATDAVREDASMNRPWSSVELVPTVCFRGNGRAGVRLFSDWAGSTSGVAPLSRWFWPPFFSLAPLLILGEPPFLHHLLGHHCCRYVQEGWQNGTFGGVSLFQKRR